MIVGVLGATGMLGHNAALAAVDAGHRVRVIHRPGSNPDRMDDIPGERAEADLDAPDGLADALAGLDCVIHAAAYYPTVPKPWRAEVAHATAQSERLLAACRQAGVRRLVYVGGSIALRKAPAGALGDETCVQTHRPAGRNPYVQVKWALDQQFAAASDVGLTVCTAIPSMTFGAFDYGPTTGQILTRLANGNLPSYVRGQRNVIAAHDAGRGILAVAERGTAGQRYLLTGTNTSMDTLVALAAEMTGQPTPRAVPLPVARLVSAAQGLGYRLGGPEPAISATAIAVMASGQHLSGERARRDLDFAAQLDLPTTLRRALDWFADVGYVRPRAS